MHSSTVHAQWEHTRFCACAYQRIKAAGQRALHKTPAKRWCVGFNRPIVVADCEATILAIVRQEY